jgi:DNA modification methylase
VTGIKQSNYPIQLSLLEVDNNEHTNLTSTFIDNMKLPIHRWYRYSAGFSAKWVEETISNILSEKNIPNNDFVILDPFVGSGTTILAAAQMGVEGYGFESHPLISKIAKTKLLWDTDVNKLRKMANNIFEIAKTISKKTDVYPDLIYRCYDNNSLEEIDRLKYALKEVETSSDEYKLSWLAFVSILRSTSHAGTAQWQYVLPNKSKSKVLNVYDAFFKKIDIMCNDILSFSSTVTASNDRKGAIIKHDVRTPYNELNNTVDLIITSPPYANNYDYADATRLELCILGEIKGWGDLQNTVRNSLIRSCSQQVSREKSKTYDYLDEPILEPIRDEIYNVCKKLDSEKDLHGGKKNYHTMIALYFLDLANVWLNLRNLCKKNSDICFVIGDSAPYGIYVPVDEWLGKLAMSAGFNSYQFIKTRDRNTKWKNRKHTVPLKEGQLWIKG